MKIEINRYLGTDPETCRGLLSHPVLRDKQAFSTFCTDVVRAIVMVCKKDVDKVPVGMTGFRGGPRDSSTSDSLSNEHLQKGLERLREYQDASESTYQVGYFPGSSGLCVFVEGEHPFLLYCDPVLPYIPDDEPDWYADHQKMLDIILNAQEVAHACNLWLYQGRQLAAVADDPKSIPAMLAGLSSFQNS